MDDRLETNLDKNLDSLLHLWYVGHAQERNENLTNIDADTSNLIPEFSDSVYIDRLSKIPSLVDLTYNQIVKRYIEVYSQKRRDQVEAMLGLTHYYFPVFDAIFDYHNVPNELKYMSIIESALNPRAYSRARAVGIWQFMYGTGKFYGLTINSYVDERRDPIKATHAACRFVKDLYEIYGDWTLVIAAYNCGPGNVNKAIRRSGGKRNYWDIYYFLPRETRGHVPAFIAAVYIMHYYIEHNLYPKQVSLPIPSDTIMINDELHLEQVADVLQIPIEKLRDMNPQYRLDIVPGHQQPYALRLPLDKSMAFIDLQDSIFAYRDSVYFNPDDAIQAPKVASYSYDAPPSDKYDLLHYTVKSGDNLGFIADWYDVGVSDLRRWNNIYRNLIRSGQRLKIYIHKSKVDKYRDINDMTFAEKQKMAGVIVEPKPVESNLSDGEFTYYTVKRGDTLWDIAKLYPGVTDTDIMQWNDIRSAGNIRPGDRIKIKKLE
jgi:membrane-bound lytic murein transglycosylase D